MFFTLTRLRINHWRGYAILAIWALTLLIGSQIPSLGFPVRLARDLAIPLALLGGVFVQSLASFILRRNIPRLFLFLFLAAAFGTGLLTLNARFQQAVAPNPLINHLGVDSQAADYITRELPLSSRIVVFQDDVYLDAFTPLHTVDRINDGPRVNELLKMPDGIGVIKDYDYIYLEERFDREDSWINNRGIIQSYLASPVTSLTASFAQTEKKVSIFHINKDRIPSVLARTHLKNNLGTKN